MVLEKTLESLLDCKEIQPVHPKGDQSWVFTSRGEAKDSALLSSGDTDLLEPPERPQGSPASSSVWRDQGVAEMLRRGVIEVEV